MDGTLRPDIGNFVMIGLLGFIFVWLANRGLRAIGKSSWTTAGV